jgi:hypothetical protein
MECCVLPLQTCVANVIHVLFILLQWIVLSVLYMLLHIRREYYRPLRLSCHLPLFLVYRNSSWEGCGLSLY